ncbi:hypothetical protein GCM10023238_27090 [Streptomyces heliomycini]
MLAFVDQDTRDWRRAGRPGDRRRGTPDVPGRGTVRPLHDSGGDRSQTVRALDILIPRLTGPGLRFTTIADLVGADGLTSPVDTGTLWKGRVFVTAVTVSDTAVSVVGVLLLVVGTLVLARCALMLVLAHHHAHRRPHPGAGRPVTGPSGVVVPAYNERLCIATTLRSLAVSDHPVEIIVVDAVPATAPPTSPSHSASRRSRCSRGRTAGKASALDAASGGPPTTSSSCSTPTRSSPPRPSTAASSRSPTRRRRHRRQRQGGQPPRSAGTLAAHRVRDGLHLDRRTYDLLRCMPTVPGAVGAFRVTALRDAGMMSGDTSRDTDITMALHRAGWEVRYTEDALAWTEAPASLRQLWRQRYRWSYGTMQPAWKHRHALVERGHADTSAASDCPAGRLPDPHPAPRPVIDLLTVLRPGLRNRSSRCWRGPVCWRADRLRGYAFRLDGESLRPLWTLPLQQVVYRQLMYLVLVQACLTAVNGYGCPGSASSAAATSAAAPAPRPER